MRDPACVINDLAGVEYDQDKIANATVADETLSI